MTNETRLVVEALLFVVGMLGVIGVAYVRGRQTGPTAVDNLRRVIDGMARDMNERMDEYLGCGFMTIAGSSLATCVTAYLSRARDYHVRTAVRRIVQPVAGAGGSCIPGRTGGL